MSRSKESTRWSRSTKTIFGYGDFGACEDLRENDRKTHSFAHLDHWNDGDQDFLLDKLPLRYRPNGPILLR